MSSLFGGPPSRKAALAQAQIDFAAAQAEVDRLEQLRRAAVDRMTEAQCRVKHFAFEEEVLGYSDALKEQLKKLEPILEGRSGYHLSQKGLADRNGYSRYAHYRWSTKAKAAQQFLLSLEQK